MKTDRPSQPSRRYLRFSLRTLLIVVTVLAVWLGYLTDRAMKQRQTVSIVRKYGGGVDYLHQYDPFESSREPTPLWAPEWLQKLVGEDYFVTLTSVGFGINPHQGTTTRPLDEMTDAEFDCICRVPALSSLVLEPDFQLSDDHLKRLCVASKLKELRAFGPVTDQGLASIGKLAELRTLTIGANRPHEYSDPSESLQITDAGVKNLLGCNELLVLVLTTAQLTDEGLIHIAKFGKLRSLVLDNTLITDTGLAHLAKLSQLKSISVARTRITDAGLCSLAGLSKLTRIAMPNTAVTDAGIASLATLPSLKTLEVDGTAIDGSSLDMLPALRILWASETDVNDVGMQAICTLVNLDVLGLPATDVTDAGVAELAGCSKLRHLVLSNTRVTDACLAHLQTLPLLRLNVEGTAVTDAAADKLRAKGVEVYTTHRPQPRTAAP